MKHDLQITLSIILLFLVAQFVGLHIVLQYVDIEASAQNQEISIRDGQYFIEPPEMENTDFSFIPIFIAIIVGTVLVLIIAKFNQVLLWKTWFFISVFIALILAIGPYILMTGLGYTQALILSIIVAALIAALKILKPITLVHNISEVLVYGGIAALFVPLLTPFSATMLLLIISLYDAYAVWKSKHMIKLANFQTESNVFAGLFIPKKGVKLTDLKDKKPAKKQKTGKTSHAILGGGDIAFPLLFAGTMMAFFNSIFTAVLIVLCTSIALGILLLMSKKNTFYPAMPFISIGAYVGFLLSVIL